MTYKSYTKREKKWLQDKLGDQLTHMAADAVKQAIANASQPKGSGKHPQRQSSTLVRSITLDVDRSKLEAKVGIMKGRGEGDKALEYAAGLEFGTAIHPPYPFLFPAVEQVTQKAKDYFR